MIEVLLSDLDAVKIECVSCGAAVTFDLSAVGERSKTLPTHCPICGAHYGISPTDNVFGKLHEAVGAATEAKGARISILCEEEEK
jgi:NAD-dependent SIR2 family protein deacetylase